MAPRNFDEEDAIDGGPLGDDPPPPPPAPTMLEETRMPPAAMPPAADPRPARSTAPPAPAAPRPGEIPACAPPSLPCPANPLRVALVDGRDVWSVGLSRRFNRAEALNLAAWIIAVTGANRSEYEPVVSAIKPHLPPPPAPPAAAKK